MISWFITQGSSYAADIDNLILLVGLIVGVWFVLAEAVFFWLMFKFRAKPGVGSAYVTGETKAEKKWVSYPHYAVLVFDVIILAAALRVWSDVKITQPATDERVRIIAQQWAWTFIHAGADGQLDTADDVRTVDELNLQLNRRYQYELHSRDVLHSFSVPVFRLKQDAVPGRAITGWFQPTVAGEFDIQCAEICGIGHGLMPARVRVRSAEAQAAWLASLPAADVAAAAPATPTAATVAAAAEHSTHGHTQGHGGTAQ
jgi:cytochrome c oxidase subunit 2